MPSHMNIYSYDTAVYIYLHMAHRRNTGKSSFAGYWGGTEFRRKFGLVVVGKTSMPTAFAGDGFQVYGDIITSWYLCRVAVLRVETFAYRSTISSFYIDSRL